MYKFKRNNPSIVKKIKTINGINVSINDKKLETDHNEVEIMFCLLLTWMKEISCDNL